MDRNEENFDRLEAVLEGNVMIERGLVSDAASAKDVRMRSGIAKSQTSRVMFRTMRHRQTMELLREHDGSNWKDV